MKRSTLYHRAGLMAAGCLTLFPSTGAYAVPPAPAASDSKIVGKEEPARADVARAQQDLARVSELYRQGLSSAEEVAKAKIEVAEARIRLSTALRQSPAMMISDLETLVGLREQLLALATERYKAGVLASRELSAARIARAEARIRLELTQLVVLREGDLAAARAAYAAGVATRPEVDRASQSLEKARRRLAANEADQKPGE